MYCSWHTLSSLGGLGKDFRLLQVSALLYFLNEDFLACLHKIVVHPLPWIPLSTSLLYLLWVIYHSNTLCTSFILSVREGRDLFLFLFMCALGISFLIMTLVFWIRVPPLWPHLNLITALKALSPNKVTLGVRAIIYEFWGDRIQPIILSHFKSIYRISTFLFTWNLYKNGLCPWP